MKNYWFTNHTHWYIVNQWKLNWMERIRSYLPIPIGIIAKVILSLQAQRIIRTHLTECADINKSRRFWWFKRHMTHEKRATNSIPTATVAILASPPVPPSNNNQNHYGTTTTNNSNQTHLLWHSRRLYFIAVEMIRKSRKSVDVNPTSVREKKKVSLIYKQVGSSLSNKWNQTELQLWITHSKL